MESWEGKQIGGHIHSTFQASEVKLQCTSSCLFNEKILMNSGAYQLHVKEEYI